LSVGNMWSAFIIVLVCGIVGQVLAEKSTDDEKNTYQGQKLSWTEDDGLEIKIIRPISEEKCKIKSQIGDTVEQYYKLSDKDGGEIGSNFGKDPYIFTLGENAVIKGMDRAMIGMCIGEKRKVVIPSDLGFGEKGRERDEIKGGQKLYYTVQLVDISRPVPGEEWTTDEGIKIKVTHKIEEKECKKSVPGDTIHQHYKLHLADGTFVDSSFTRGTPFIFKLGAGQVIKGMDIAMQNMCEHEKRHVVIPPEFAYGSAGRESIPSNSTLYFDIELFKLVKKDEL
jgi:FK506-binding protein 9/10